MRTLNKVIRIAHAASESVEGSIYLFLQEYRQTPHSTTGVAPSHAVMGHVGRETIPHHTTWQPREINHQVTLNRRQKTNELASRKRRAKWSDLREGDQVLLKDRYPGSKFRLPFEVQPWTITRRQGTLVTASQGEETVTRDTSFFKKYHQVATRHNESATEQRSDQYHLTLRMHP